MDIGLQFRSRNNNIQQIHVPLGCIDKRKTRAATFHVEIVHFSLKKGAEKGELIYDVILVMVDIAIYLQANQVKFT